MDADYKFGLEEIKSTIQQMKQKAGQIDPLLEKVNSIVSNLESVWTGSDAQEYVNKINEYRPSIVKLENAYIEAADVLQKTQTLEEEEASGRATAAQSSLNVQ